MTSAVNKHGTRGGYIRHRWLKETACDLCKLANANYSRLYFARRKVEQPDAAS